MKDNVTKVVDLIKKMDSEQLENLMIYLHSVINIDGKT